MRMMTLKKIIMLILRGGGRSDGMIFSIECLVLLCYSLFMVLITLVKNMIMMNYYKKEHPQEKSAATTEFFELFHSLPRTILEVCHSLPDDFVFHKV